MSSIVVAVRRIRGALAAATAWASGLLFGVIFAVNIAQIVMRQVNGGWIWVSDLSRLLFAWTVMLGAAAAYATHEHIIASFLTERVPRRWQWIPGLFVRVVELLVAFVLVVAGLEVAANRMQLDYIQLGVSTGYAYYAVPALGALMLLFGITSRLTPPAEDERIDQETELQTPLEDAHR